MYEDYQALKFERRGKVLVVTMDNPPMNAASFQLHEELSYVFYDIARDKECSVVVLTGEAVSAPEAVQMGLINKAVPLEDLDDTVYALADRLANGLTLALNATKRSINMLLRRQVEGVIEAHLGLELLSQLSRDHKAAVRAFVAKAQPKFEGR
jgi:enoyl-CoA hydratase/carnithine racemase